MRAVVFPAPNHVELWDLPPSPVSAGQVLIRTHFTSISAGTELMVLDGRLPLIQRGEVSYPLVPGYENVGRVVEVGPEVVGLTPGDWVCCEGAGALQGVTSCWGAHVEQVRLEADQVFSLPRGVPPEHGVFMALAAIALHGIQRGRVGVGDTVVIFGQGIVGLLTGRLARVAGAARVIAVDLMAGRLTMARELGADDVVLARPEALIEAAAAVVALTGGHGADVVIDATGSSAAAAGAVRACRERGRLVLLGMYAQPITFDYWELYTREVDVLPARGAGPEESIAEPYYRWTWRRTYEAALRLIGSRQLRLEPLITHRLPIERIAEGYAALRESPERTLKVLLTWR